MRVDQVLRCGDGTDDRDSISKSNSNIAKGVEKKEKKIDLDHDHNK